MANLNDYTTINIKSGHGGRGAISFYSNRNGPCGGKGGAGGNIIVQGSNSINNLDYFQFKKHFFAASGEGGKSNNTTGKNGEDIIIKVPYGTQCTWNDKSIYVINSDKHTLLSGGRGGLGNGSFKSSLNQIPRFSQPGEPGSECKLILELKFLGDIGLIGAPNAGKSTLIGALTNFKSEVGDYAFTTVRPWQGMCGNVCIVDLPGIIENAHEGKGMGLQFLRHAENCKYLFLIIDITNEPIKHIDMLLKELSIYKNIVQPLYLIFNKIEGVNSRIKKDLLLKYKDQFKYIKFISALFDIGISNLKEDIIKMF